ncbi:LysR substrate-binding domain-containing protein [Candidimonas nitroreducens]|uniref:LysR family transcriptional regulator n=1 Tax=Candidimonas nitroreducens TaxID=683354 RepID=A0A225MTL3_9BURK|nr:LysR substrate-binding domain-containing protein [Candidimonas nitroreducens]OWT63803.1 LysR family transcriptional regulator [Candidimonas nitroreducens]
MALNLRQIEVFRAVMLTGTINGASKLLYVSPPAVSRLLAHAELTLGMALFERIKGRLHATPEARRLFIEVENAYLGIQKVNTVARELLENQRGSLRIAAHATIGGSLVPRALSQFQRAHPNIGIGLECVRQSELKERMLNQQADLGITLFPMEHPNLGAIKLCNVPIVCVVANGHPLAKRVQVTARDLCRHPIVSYEPGTPFGLLLDEIFANSGYPKSIRAQAGTPHETCSLIRAGIEASGIVDRYSAEEFSHGSRGLRIMTISGAPVLQSRIIHRCHEPMSRISKTFVTLMHDLVKGS